VGNDYLYKSILDVCADHQSSNRALTFGFLLYNVQNPQIIKVINDPDYWKALHATAGRYLSLFYVVQPDEMFGKDLSDNDGIERRGLHEIKGIQFIPILKQYFELDEQIDLPAILFFQVKDRMIVDYFIVKLDKHHIEDAYMELKQHLDIVVKALEKVKEENYINSNEMFDLLKQDMKAAHLKQNFFKLVNSLPMQLFLGWITGKM
jgi:hypothetical protein